MLDIITAHKVMRTAIITSILTDKEFREVMYTSPTNRGYDYKLHHPNVSIYVTFTDIIDTYEHYLKHCKTST